MPRNGIECLTQKDLTVRWSVSLRTVQNDRKRFGLKPWDYLGHIPLFTFPDVIKMEERRRKCRLKQFCGE